MADSIKKHLKEKASEGILQVDVRPSKLESLSAWRNFCNRLRKIFDKDIEDLATEGARAAHNAAHDKLRAQGIRNAQIEAEIKLTLAEARKVEAEARMTEIEVEKAKAFTAIEIQAKKIEKLQCLGIDVVPVIKNGELVGLSIKRAKAKPLHLIDRD